MDIEKALETAIEAALKLISYNQIDVKKSYKLQRSLENVGKADLLRPTLFSDDNYIVLTDSVIKIRCYYPLNKDDINDVIVFMHGGGWTTGNIESYNRVCAVAARQTRNTVVSIDYRLAPEHKFPAGFEDCYETIKYCFKNSWNLFGISPDKITIMGDSAGGNIAAAVSLKARDTGDFTPKRQILIYPSTYKEHTEKSPYPSVRTNGKDYVLTSERIEEYTDFYKSKPEDAQSPYFAPLNTHSFANQPDTLIITAEFDPLRDEGEDYGQRLRDAGNKVRICRINKTIHGFLGFPAGTQPVKKCFNEIKTFLNGG